MSTEFVSRRSWQTTSGARDGARDSCTTTEATRSRTFGGSIRVEQSVDRSRV